MQGDVTITAVGGPTLLIEWLGLRFLTDPTLDPAGGDYPVGPVTLRKTGGPALGVEQLGRIDAVLLSHDQHDDNLDRAGRALLPAAGRVLTTPGAASRLGGHAVGLASWESLDLAAPGGRTVRVTATPGRHGPPGIEPVSGDVTGFVLSAGLTGGIYVSGDTVWYEGVAEAARRFPVRVAVLFLGAARLAEIGPAHLTMDAADAVEAARAFADALIVPAHFRDWAHLTEGRAEVDAAFADAGLAGRLRWPTPGVAFTEAI